MEKTKVILNRLLTAFLLSVLFGSGSVKTAESAPPWQLEWDRSIKGADKEGQVKIYSSQRYDLLLNKNVAAPRGSSITIFPFHFGLRKSQ